MSTSKSGADDARDLVTYKEAGAMLGLGREAIRKLIRDGDLEAVKVTAWAVRIRRDSIERHIRRHTLTFPDD